MSRIRSIKPDFWTSEQILECSTNARLLFIGLWNFCDDAGRHPYSAKQAKAEVFPADDFTEKQISGMLQELSTNGLITRYVANNKDYFYVNGWAHQRIDKPHAPKYPDPFDDNSKIVPGTLPPDRIGKDKIGKDSSAPSAVQEKKESGKSRKQPEVPLPDDWKPNLNSVQKAQALGFNPREIGREAEKFKNHARQKDRRAARWDAAFDNWIINSADYQNKAPPETKSTGGYSALPGSPEFQAWRTYHRDKGDKGLMRILDERQLEGRAFNFESQWPPGHKSEAA